MMTMEERVQSLEQEVAGLKAKLNLPKPTTKDWESTVGMFENDSLFSEALRLGREYRESQPLPEECEGA
jgi:hypothetical protein